MLFGKYIKKETVIWELATSIASYRSQKERIIKKGIGPERVQYLQARIDQCEFMAVSFGIEKEVALKAEQVYNRLCKVCRSA